MIGCVTCQKSNTDGYSRQTKLASMPTVEHPFEDIAIDFVRELAESDGFNTILVVTKWFTKV